MFYSAFPELRGSSWRTLQKLIWIHIPWALHSIKKTSKQPLKNLISLSPLTIPASSQQITNTGTNTRQTCLAALKKDKHIFTAPHLCKGAGQTWPTWDEAAPLRRSRNRGEKSRKLTPPFLAPAGLARWLLGNNLRGAHHSVTCPRHRCPNEEATGLNSDWRVARAGLTKAHLFTNTLFQSHKFSVIMDTGCFGCCSLLEL